MNSQFPTLPRPLRGIIPPVATPLMSDLSLDVAGLERLIEHHIQGGVHGLFLLGTTGEGPSLSQAVRHQFVNMACDQVAGRLPVLVSITDTSYVASLELAQTAFAAGATAVVAAPPYYLPIGDDELVLYFERLADEAPLPVLLYNIPICTKTAFTVETVRRLMERPNVVGIKDSSGDLKLLGRLVELARHDELFTVLMGPEQLLPEAMARGAHGGVCGGANMFPELYVALYRACRDHDPAEIARLHRQVLRVSDEIYSCSDDPFRFISTTKQVLADLDICQPFVAPPLRRLTSAQRQRLQATVTTFASFVSAR